MVIEPKIGLPEPPAPAGGNIAVCVLPEKRQSVVHFESQDKCLDKVCSLLDVCDVFGLLPSPDLHVPVLDVEPDLKLQVLNDRGENLHPVVFQRGEPVGGVELSDLYHAYIF